MQMHRVHVLDALEAWGDHVWERKTAGEMEESES